MQKISERVSAGASEQRSQWISREQLLTKIFLIPLITVAADGHLVVVVSIATGIFQQLQDY